jgi:hypothetical protein
VWRESWVLVLHTFATMLDAEAMESFRESFRDLYNHGVLVNYAVNGPTGLETERRKLIHAVRSSPFHPEGDANVRAARAAEALHRGASIMRVSVIGGEK